MQSTVNASLLLAAAGEHHLRFDPVAKCRSVAIAPSSFSMSVMDDYHPGISLGYVLKPSSS